MQRRQSNSLWSSTYGLTKQRPYTNTNRADPGATYLRGVHDTWHASGFVSQSGYAGTGSVTDLAGMTRVLDPIALYVCTIAEMTWAIGCSFAVSAYSFQTPASKWTRSSALGDA